MKKRAMTIGSSSRTGSRNAAAVSLTCDNMEMRYIR
jgi:hypothetical protein